MQYPTPSSDAETGLPEDIKKLVERLAELSRESSEPNEKKRHPADWHAQWCHSAGREQRDIWSSIRIPKQDQPGIADFEAQTEQLLSAAPQERTVIAIKHLISRVGILNSALWHRQESTRARAAQRDGASIVARLVKERWRIPHRNRPTVELACVQFTLALPDKELEPSIEQDYLFAKIPASELIHAMRMVYQDERMISPKFRTIMEGSPVYVNTLESLRLISGRNPSKFQESCLELECLCKGIERSMSVFRHGCDTKRADDARNLTECALNGRDFERRSEEMKTALVKHHAVWLELQVLLLEASEVAGKLEKCSEMRFPRESYHSPEEVVRVNNYIVASALVRKSRRLVSQASQFYSMGKQDSGWRFCREQISARHSQA